MIPDKTTELKYLFNSVKQWFNQPEQIQHYTHEIEQGPTVAEEVLLSLLPDSGSVLEVGCGAGRISLYLAERGYRVIGVDVSEGLLSKTREISKRKRLSIDFIVTEGTQIPFRESIFDSIVGIKILCYIPTKELRQRYFKELYRVLKPDGVCLLEQNIVPEEYISDTVDEYYHSSPASKFSIVERGDNFPKGNGYVRWFTESELLNEIEGTDFKVTLFESDAKYGGTGYTRLIGLKKI